MKLPLLLTSLLVLGASAFTTPKTPKATLPAKESTSKVSVYRDGYYGGGWNSYGSSYSPYSDRGYGYDRYNRGGYGGYYDRAPSLIEAAVGSPNYYYGSGYGRGGYGYGGYDRYGAGGYGYNNRYGYNNYNNRYGYNNYNRYGYGSGYNSYSPYYDDSFYNRGYGYGGGLIGPSNYTPSYGSRYYDDYDYDYRGGLSYNRIGSPYSRSIGSNSIGSRANGDYYGGYSNFDSPLYRNSYRSLKTVN